MYFTNLLIAPIVVAVFVIVCSCVGVIALVVYCRLKKKREKRELWKKNELQVYLQHTHAYEAPGPGILKSHALYVELYVATKLPFVLPAAYKPRRSLQYYKDIYGAGGPLEPIYETLPDPSQSSDHAYAVLEGPTNPDPEVHYEIPVENTLSNKHKQISTINENEWNNHKNFDVRHTVSN